MSTPQITPLQHWLDRKNMTANSLGNLLNIPRETIQSLARGEADRISLNYLASIADATKLSLEAIIETDKQVDCKIDDEEILPELLGGHPAIDQMLRCIEEHLHQHTESEIGKYASPDFTCSGETYQRALLTQRSMNFQQMSDSNQNNDDSVTNTFLRATWMTLDGELIEDCKVIFCHWLTTSVDPHGTVTKNYTTTFFRLTKSTSELAEKELPQIDRWWWRIPTEFPQPQI